MSFCGSSVHQTYLPRIFLHVSWFAHENESPVPLPTYASCTSLKISDWVGLFATSGVTRSEITAAAATTTTAASEVVAASGVSGEVGSVGLVWASCLHTHIYTASPVVQPALHPRAARREKGL